MDSGKKRAAPTHPGKPQRPTKVRIVGQGESLIGNQFSGGFGSSGALADPTREPPLVFSMQPEPLTDAEYEMWSQGVVDPRDM